jgi:AcrR family transcriptional regulator
MTDSPQRSNGVGEKLPRGSHGLPPEFVVRSQRERLFAGMARVMGRSGYAATTVDDIAAESGVSRKALYAHFSGKEDVMLQAHKAVVNRIVTGAGPAIAEQDDWKSALRALLDWALEFFSREPALAHLTLIEMGAATPASQRLQRDSLDAVRALIEQAIAQGARPLSSTTIDGMLGGLIYVVAQAAEAGPPEDLVALRPELMSWFVLVLEGPEAAKRELEEEITTSPCRRIPSDRADPRTAVGTGSDGQ